MTQQDLDLKIPFTHTHTQPGHRALRLLLLLFLLSTACIVPPPVSLPSSECAQIPHGFSLFRPRVFLPVVFGPVSILFWALTMPSLIAAVQQAVNRRHGVVFTICTDYIYPDKYGAQCGQCGQVFIEKVRAICRCLF